MKTETIVQETACSQHVSVLRLLRTEHPLDLDLCRARKFFSTENGKVRSMTGIAGQALPESPIQGRFREKNVFFRRFRRRKWILPAFLRPRTNVIFDPK